MMNHPHYILRDATRYLMAGFHWVTMLAVVYAFTGCSGAKREEDGDKEPVQSAYFVDLSPEEKSVVIPSGAASVSFPVHLSVRGIGKDLPPDINTFLPAWVGSSTSADDVVMSITIDNPNSPETDATVRIDAANLQAITNLLSDLSGEPFRFFAKFTPTKVPKGLKVTGQTVLPIKVSTGAAAQERTEKDTEDPTLVVSPGRTFFQNPDKNAHSYTVTYHGPPADLTFQLEGAGAPNFNVFIAGGFPHTLSGNGAATQLTVSRTSDSYHGPLYLVLTATTKQMPTKSDSITLTLNSL